MLNRVFDNDTICAIATPHGMGAIAVIRISGPEAIYIVGQLFTQNGKAFDTDKMVSHKAYYGHIVDQGGQRDEYLCN